MKFSAKGLACERNGRVIFSNLSFDLQAGQFLELRGANGAGKSSLLRVIAGLVPTAAGEISTDVSDLHQNLHYVAHHDAMKAALTVEENLSFWGGMLGGVNIDLATSTFSLTALRHETVQLLSAGQRRRLSLSRLKLAERLLWLLDEPMTALDHAAQDALRAVIKAHLRNGGLVIAATHGDMGLLPDKTIALGAA